jgi:hypothetical protein
MPAFQWSHCGPNAAAVMVQQEIVGSTPADKIAFDRPLWLKVEANLYFGLKG